jgi:hypothetical protein
MTYFAVPRDCSTWGLPRRAGWSIYDKTRCLLRRAGGIEAMAGHLLTSLMAASCAIAQAGDLSSREACQIELAIHQFIEASKVPGCLRRLYRMESSCGRRDSAWPISKILFLRHLRRCIDSAQFRNRLRLLLRWSFGSVASWTWMLQSSSTARHSRRNRGPSPPISEDRHLESCHVGGGGKPPSPGCLVARIKNSALTTAPDLSFQ